MHVQLLILYTISTLQRVYLRVYDGGVYQQWMISKVCSLPWFRLEQRATGEVLDGAGNGSNSMLRG